jgi:hypothetical protein
MVRASSRVGPDVASADITWLLLGTGRSSVGDIKAISEVAALSLPHGVVPASAFPEYSADKGAVKGIPEVSEAD